MRLMINVKYLRIKYTVLESAFIPKKVFFCIFHLKLLILLFGFLL